MIHLRRLEESDAIFMLEWMHDFEIQKNFQKDMLNMTLQDAVNFCKKSDIPKNLQNRQNLHFAVVDEKNEYLGTISLKEININNLTAEYAISMRKKAQGEGIARIATGLLLKKAFDEYGLHKIYLNVLSDNERAIHFYEKSGFVFEGEFRECLIKEGRYVNLKWYGMLKNEFDQLRFEEC